MTNCDKPYPCSLHGTILVRAADVKHLLDVYIDNGMVEGEDEVIVDRLWKAVHD